MTRESLQTWLSRALLAYVLALPVFVVAAAKATEGQRSYVITVRMTTASPGLIQLFADTGQGFSETESYVASLTPSSEPQDYNFFIPPGLYHILRIDPGTGPGRYTLHGVTIRRDDGTVMMEVPLNEVSPMFGLNLVERTSDRLVVETPSTGPIDPAIGWMPRQPLRMFRRTGRLAGLIARFGVAWAVALGLVLLAGWLAERMAPRLRPLVRRIGEAARARPRAAIGAFAVAGVLLSAYPVIFLGRSLYSPNNGLSRLLYESPPFVPGATDTVMEDVRRSDTIASLAVMMPFARIERRAVAAGEMPLWNRHNGAGRPLWGQGYEFMLDPLHWIALAAPDLAWGLDLKTLAHRLVFAIGMGLLAFAATNAWLPSAILAASVPFIAFFTYRLNHPQLFAFTYAPFAILGWLMLLRDEARARGRGALLLTIATALVLVASQPKESAAMLIGVWTAGVLAVLLARLPWRRRLVPLAIGAAAGLAAMLLATPHWLIFLDTLKESETLYDKPHAFFGGMTQWLAVFLGPFAPGPIEPGFHALALVALVAALTAGIRLWRHRTVLACALTAIAMMLVAFGAVPEAVIVRVPMIGQIAHFNDIAQMAAAPALLVVVAFGLDVLLRAGVWRGTIVAVIGAAAAWMLTTAVYARAPLGTFVPFAVLALSSLLPVLPLALAPGIAGTSGIRAAAASAAIVAMLLPGGLHTDTPWTPLNALLFQPRPRQPLERRSPAVDEIHGAIGPFRTVGVDWTLFPGSHILYDFEGISGGGDALQIARYERLLDAAGLWRAYFAFVTLRAEGIDRAAPFLDMVNVGYLVALPGTPLPGTAGEHVPPGDRVAIARRPSAWPRAFFTNGVSTYREMPELLAQARAGAPIASIQAGDTRAEQAVQGMAAATSPAVPATNYKLTVNATRFMVRAPSAGVAVLAETYLPDDFVVTLNGRPAPYFRVNQAFKAVRIPAAGDWIVEMTYRPAHWRLSWVMAGIGALVAAGLAIVVRRQGVSARDAAARSGTSLPPGSTSTDRRTAAPSSPA